MKILLTATFLIISFTFDVSAKDICKSGNCSEKIICDTKDKNLKKAISDLYYARNQLVSEPIENEQYCQLNNLKQRYDKYLANANNAKSFPPSKLKQNYLYNESDASLLVNLLSLDILEKLNMNSEITLPYTIEAAKLKDGAYFLSFYSEGDSGSGGVHYNLYYGRNKTVKQIGETLSSFAYDEKLGILVIRSAGKSGAGFYRETDEYYARSNDGFKLIHTINYEADFEKGDFAKQQERGIKKISNYEKRLKFNSDTNIGSIDYYYFPEFHKSISEKE